MKHIFHLYIETNFINCYFSKNRFTKQLVLLSVQIVFSFEDYRIFYCGQVMVSTMSTGC